jgi:hypothetical protein
MPVLPPMEDDEIFRAHDFDGDMISIAHRNAVTAEDAVECPGCGEKHAHPALTSIAVMKHDHPIPIGVLLTDDEAAELLAALGRHVFGIAGA